jgi:hypothetical protein
MIDAMKAVIEKVNMPIFSPMPSWILFKSLKLFEIKKPDYNEVISGKQFE